MAGPTVVATIIANDEASAKLREVAAEAQALQNKVGRSRGRMTDEVAAAQKEFTKAQRELVAAQDEHTRAIARTHAGLKEMLATVKQLATIGIAHTAYEGVKEGAAIQNELIKGRAAGIPAEELAALNTQSADIAAQTLSIARAEIIKTGEELRAILLKSEEMTNLLPDMIKAAGALKATGNGGNAEGLQQFAKAAEIMGLTASPEKFHTAVDAFVKASQVFRELLTPETYRKTVAAAGIAAAGWSERFRNTVFVSLVAEQGERAGTGLNQMQKLITSGFNNNKAALLEWERLGLIRPDQVNDKKGQLSLKAGEHPEGYQLAVTDPDKFVQSVLRPAMEKIGLTKTEDIISEYRRLFPNQNAAQEAYKLDTQAPLLAKDAANIQAAQGLDAANASMDSATNALSALGVAAKDFVGNLTAPAMQDAAHAMAAVAKGISQMSDAAVHLQDEYPHAARAVGAFTLALTAIAGVKGFQAISGFVTGGEAIKASALRLDAAANALDTAAAALDRAAAAQGLAGKAGAVATAESAAVGAAAGGVTATEGAVAGAAVTRGVAARGAAGLASRTFLPLALLDSFYEGLKALDDGGYLKAASEKMRALDKAMGFDPDKFKPQIQANEKAQEAALKRAGDMWSRLFGGAAPGAPTPTPARPEPGPADASHLWAGGTPALPSLPQTPVGMTGLPEGWKLPTFAPPGVPTPAPLPPAALPAPVKVVITGFEADKVADAFNKVGYTPPVQRYDAELEAQRGRAYQHMGEHEPWTPQTAAANAGPVKVDVASTVTGNVDGRASLDIHISSESILGGIKQLINSEIALHGDIHGAAAAVGASHFVPSPRTSAANGGHEL